MKRGKKIQPIKKKKHDRIVNDFEKAKHNHLEKLATKMLKKDEMYSKLREKKINSNFLNLF